MKTCNKCITEKSETEFKKDPRNNDGLQGICKECNKEWQRARREARMSGAIALVPKTEKCCNRCVVTKPTADFYKDAGCADGLSTLCKVCRNQSMGKWRDKNRGAYNANMREMRATQKDTFKNIDLKRTYGITLDTYNAMKRSQNEVCAICEKPPQGKRPLVVDHNHTTGAVRELLCYGCNRALHVLEDMDLLERAHTYLTKHEK